VLCPPPSEEIGQSTPNSITVFVEAVLELVDGTGLVIIQDLFDQLGVRVTAHEDRCSRGLSVESIIRRYHRHVCDELQIAILPDLPQTLSSLITWLSCIEGKYLVEHTLVFDVRLVCFVEVVRIGRQDMPR
jgi:hypothetical protein